MKTRLEEYPLAGHLRFEADRSSSIWIAEFIKKGGLHLLGYENKEVDK